MLNSHQGHSMIKIIWKIQIFLIQSIQIHLQYVVCHVLQSFVGYYLLRKLSHDSVNSSSCFRSSQFSTVICNYTNLEFFSSKRFYWRGCYSKLKGQYQKICKKLFTESNPPRALHNIWLCRPLWDFKGSVNYVHMVTTQSKTNNF